MTVGVTGLPAGILQGTVTRVSADGSVDIRYSDGQIQTGVSAALLQASVPALVSSNTKPELTSRKRPLAAAPSTASNDDLTSKQLRRMQRNRESAQQSRERKKAYIDELEVKVQVLTTSLQELERENARLKIESTLRAAEPNRAVSDLCVPESAIAPRSQDMICPPEDGTCPSEDGICPPD